MSRHLWRCVTSCAVFHPVSSSRALSRRMSQRERWRAFAERERLQGRVALLRRRLDDIDVPYLQNSSHIVPVMVGDAVLCKHISDLLLNQYSIYVHPINYPTVPRGTERLRITASPFHTDADVEHLIDALVVIRSQLGIARAA